MKKKIAIVAVVASIGLVSVHQAMAGWGNQGRMQNGYQNVQQMQGQRAMNAPVRMQLDPATQEKIDKFFADNQELHKSLIVKRAELGAMMRADNPDSAKVGKLAGELFDLRVSLKKKAEEAGVDQYLGRGFMGGDMDGRRGGHHKGGKGGGRFF